MTHLSRIRPVLKAALLLAAVAPIAAYADIIWNPRVDSVGVQGGQMYIASPDLPANCNGVAYLSLGASGAQSTLAVALSGRLNGAKLGRIDVSGTSQCFIEIVQL